MNSLLVIDNKIDGLSLIKSSLLERLSFQVYYYTSDYTKICDFIRSNIVDAIIINTYPEEINALSILKKIKNSFLPQPVIMIGPPVDNEILRNFFISGAFDYISVNFTIRQLYKAFYRIRTHLYLNNKNNYFNQILNSTFHNHTLINNLLKEKAFPSFMINDLMELYSTKKTDAIIQFAILEVDDFDNNARILKRDGLDILEIIDNIIFFSGKLLYEFQNFKAIVTEGDTGCVNYIFQKYIQKKPSPKNSSFEECEIVMYFEKLIKTLNNYLNISVTAGIGKEYKSFNDISFSYLDAKDALRHKYVLGTNRVLQSSWLDNYTFATIINYPYERERELLTFVLMGDEKAIKAAANILDDIHCKSKVDLLGLTLVLSRIQANIKYEIEKKYSSLSSNLISSIDLECLSSLKSVQEISYCFNKNIHQLLEIVKVHILSNKNNIIKKICQYMIENVESDISLSTLSKTFFISRNYLSYLFKQETGINYHEFLLKVKMERAGELLRSSLLKTYEISDRLGYNDTNYFSRLFRKYYGCSPIKYRNG